jgi:hypothetical protein
MIEDRNIQELPCLNEALRHGAIVAAGGRVAAGGVIMPTQQGRCVGETLLLDSRVVELRMVYTDAIPCPNP